MPLSNEHVEIQKSISEIKYKTVSFVLNKCYKEKSEDGNFGYIEGYAATFDKDRSGDIIIPGAFKNTIKRHQKNNRPIRMFFQHNRENMIGGFPIADVKEDEKGLYVKGQINLDVQKGAEVYALAKQGVVRDMSIGFSVDDYDIDKENNQTYLKDIELWEISLVSEPMNTNAQILNVKGALPFKDYDLADQDMEWDANAANARIRKITGSDDKPSDNYKNSFMWYDSANADNFTAYKLPFTDVVDGKIKAIPRAIFAIAAVLKGARGGVDIPESDKQKVADNVNKYYKKMGLDSPLKSIDEFDCMKDVENFLKTECLLSGSQRKTFISKIKKFSCQRDVDERNDQDNLRDVKILDQKLDMILLTQKIDKCLSIIKK